MGQMLHDQENTANSEETQHQQSNTRAQKGFD
jgi:hypothetical protein